MTLLRAGDVRIDACTACRHVWLDPGEAAALQRRLDDLAGLLALHDEDDLATGARRLAERTVKPWLDERAATSFGPRDLTAIDVTLQLLLALIAS